MGVVYLITSPNGKQYVGQTMRTLEERWTELSYLKRPWGAAMHADMQLFGINTFTRRTLFESDDQAELYEAEKQCIQELNTLEPNGYNKAIGGPGQTGVPATIKQKQIVSQQSQGNNYGLGHVVTKEHRQIISNTHKGKIVSVATKQSQCEARSSLSKNEVLEIRKKYKDSYSCTVLAKEYNVSYRIIRDIVIGKTWQYLKEEEHAE